MTVVLRRGGFGSTLPGVISPPLAPGLPTTGSGPAITTMPLASPTSYAAPSATMITAMPLRTVLPSSIAAPIYTPDPARAPAGFTPATFTPSGSTAPRVDRTSTTSSPAVSTSRFSAAVRATKATSLLTPYPSGGGGGGGDANGGGGGGGGGALPQPVPTTSTLDMKAPSFLRRYGWWIAGGVGAYLLTRWFLAR